MAYKLLVMACGGTKNDTGGGKVRAIDLYAGRQFALARELYAQGWEVLILSAEHGFVSADWQLAPYNRKMDKARAAEFAADDLQWHLLRVWGQDADEIVFYGGELYHDVWDAALHANGFMQIGEGKTCVRIVGRGCGDHYSVLKQIVTESDNEAMAIPAIAA